MGRSEIILIVIVHCICVPFLCRQIQIRVNGLVAAVYQHNPVFLNDSNIADISAALQNGAELFQKTFFVAFLYCIVFPYFLIQKLVGILALGNNRIDIVHVSNVRINVLVQLFDNGLGVDCGILINRRIGVSYGNKSSHDHGTKNQNRDCCKYGALNTLESYGEVCISVLFIHGSLPAYSIVSQFLSD